MAEEDQTANENRPLVPRTAAGAAVIGVPLASVVAFAGWAGQKLLDLDEQVVRMQNELDNRQEVVDQSHQMQGRVQEIETLLSTAKQTLENVEKLGVGLDERLVRVETRVEDLREEQARIREHLDVYVPITELEIPFISKEPAFNLTPKLFEDE